MTTVRIEPLIDHPSHVFEVAVWLYREWADWGFQHKGIKEHDGHKGILIFD